MTSNKQGVCDECVKSDLSNIGRLVDGCAALIWTLVDVWQLLPASENSAYVTVSCSIAALNYVREDIAPFWL